MKLAHLFAHPQLEAEKGFGSYQGTAWSRAVIRPKHGSARLKGVP
jgi:hypothetical protein